MRSAAFTCGRSADPPSRRISNTHTTYTPSSSQVTYPTPAITAIPISPWASPGFPSPPQELAAPVGCHEPILRHSFRHRVWGLRGAGLLPRVVVTSWSSECDGIARVGLLSRAGTRPELCDPSLNPPELEWRVTCGEIFGTLFLASYSFVRTTRALGLPLLPRLVFCPALFEGLQRRRHGSAVPGPFHSPACPLSSAHFPVQANATPPCMRRSKPPRYAKHRVGLEGLAKHRTFGVHIEELLVFQTSRAGGNIHRIV